MVNNNSNYYIRADINWNKNPILLNRKVYIRIDATLFDIGTAIKTSLGCKDKNPFYFEDLYHVYSSFLPRNRRQYCLSKQKMLKNAKSTYLDQLDYLPNQKLYFNYDIGENNEFSILFYPDIVKIQNNKILIIETGHSIGLYEYKKTQVDENYKQHLCVLNNVDLNYLNTSIESKKPTSHTNAKRLYNRLNDCEKLNIPYINEREMNRCLYENAFHDSNPESVASTIKSVASSTNSTPIEIMRFMILVSELEHHKNLSVLRDYHIHIQDEIREMGFLKHPADSFSNNQLAQFYGASYLYISLLRKTSNNSIALKLAFILYKLDPKDRFDFKHVIDSIGCDMELENYILNDIKYYKNDIFHIANTALKQINNHRYNLALSNCEIINKRNEKFGKVLLYGNFINTKTINDLEILISNDDLAYPAYFVSMHDQSFVNNSTFDRFVFENSQALSKKYSLSDLETQVFLALLVGHEHVYSTNPSSDIPTISIKCANNRIDDGDNIIDLKDPFKQNEQLMNILKILINKGLLKSYCGKYQVSDEGLALMPYYRKTLPEAFKILDSLPPATDVFNE